MPSISNNNFIELDASMSYIEEMPEDSSAGIVVSPSPTISSDQVVSVSGSWWKDTLSPTLMPTTTTLDGAIGDDVINVIVGDTTPFWEPGGPCMNDVFQAAGNNNNLGCTAKEVELEATKVEGPATCEQGTIITVNITANVYFHASRYDLAFYTYTGNQTLDPVFGESCAVDILGEEDSLVFEDGVENG